MFPTPDCSTHGFHLVACCGNVCSLVQSSSFAISKRINQTIPKFSAPGAGRTWTAGTGVWQEVLIPPYIRSFLPVERNTLLARKTPDKSPRTVVTGHQTSPSRLVVQSFRFIIPQVPRGGWEQLKPITSHTKVAGFNRVIPSGLSQGCFGGYINYAVYIHHYTTGGALIPRWRCVRRQAPLLKLLFLL
jgi:hypothetical protein